MKYKPKSNSKSLKPPSVLGELALWVLAGLFMSALALVSMTGVKFLLGWGETEWIVASIAIGIASLTWGSWAALLWTRSRVLKTLMLLVVLLPGIAMAVVGGWAFLTLPENRWIWKWGWLIVAGHGVGAVVMTALVGGRQLMANYASAQIRPRQLAVGWTLYPLLVVSGGIFVVVASFVLMPDLFCDTQNTMGVIAHWIVPSLAVVLLTTALPAAASQICDRLTQMAEQ